jgi:hypothetical protein
MWDLELASPRALSVPDPYTRHGFDLGLDHEYGEAVNSSPDALNDVAKWVVRRGSL